MKSTASDSGRVCNYYQHSEDRLRRAVFGWVSHFVRQRIFIIFLQELKPQVGDRVLDVGVTGDTLKPESNFFERSYPFAENLVGTGLEKLNLTSWHFPRVKFVQGNGWQLPFRNKAFDIVFSHATIEHVGARSAQELFIRELLRVGRRCFVTTPNRLFPLELHTFIPLLHYFPPSWHRGMLRKLGMHFYACESNLNLLSRGGLLRLFPGDARVRLRFSPFYTNLIAIA